MNYILRDEKNLIVVVTEKYKIENSLYSYVTMIVDYSNSNKHKYYSFNLISALGIHVTLKDRYLK